MKKVIAIAILLAMAAVLSGCIIDFSRNRLAGDGNVQTASHALSDSQYQLLIEDIHFTSNAGKAELTINEDLAPTLTLKTDQNILDTIDISIDEDAGTITISGDENYRYKFTSFQIELGNPVHSLQIDGGFAIDCNLPSLTEFAMHARGALSGPILFDHLSSFAMILDGACELTLEGSSDDCRAEINGAANVRAFDFITEEASIELKGAATYKVHVTGTLHATIDGVGSIIYRGNPEIVASEIKGLGTISQEK